MAARNGYAKNFVNVVVQADPFPGVHSRHEKALFRLLLCPPHGKSDNSVGLTIIPPALKAESAPRKCVRQLFWLFEVSTSYERATF